MRKINWGIIGPGSIANAFSYSIENATNSQLISVFGRDIDKTNAFAEKFNIDAYHQLDDFLSQQEIDAVYIGTPHSEHFFMH